jgi:hypothetical protein
MSDYAESLRQMVRLNYVDFDELVDGAKRIEQLEAALNYVADMTYCGTDAEWHFKPGYDPQKVLDALDQSSPSPLQAPHNPGERLRNSDVAVGEGDTPKTASEMYEDTFKYLEQGR